MKRERCWPWPSTVAKGRHRSFFERRRRQGPPPSHFRLHPSRRSCPPAACGGVDSWKSSAPHLRRSEQQSQAALRRWAWHPR